MSRTAASFGAGEYRGRVVHGRCQAHGGRDRKPAAGQVDDGGRAQRGWFADEAEEEPDRTRELLEEHIGGNLAEPGVRVEANLYVPGVLRDLVEPQAGDLDDSERGRPESQLDRKAGSLACCQCLEGLDQPCVLLDEAVCLRARALCVPAIPYGPVEVAVGRCAASHSGCVAG